MGSCGNRVVSALLFTVLALVRLGAGDSIEASVKANAAGTTTFYLRSSLNSWMLGLTGSVDKKGDFSVMGGLNGPALSLGRLRSKGLAAEIHDAGHSALPRAGERTGYRADLNSSSMSTWGGVFTLPGMGGGLIVHETVPQVLFWVRGMQGFLTGELLFVHSRLKDQKPKGTWYLDDPGRPGGRFSLSALRLGWNPEHWKFSLTALVSAGAVLRPGFMAAAAFIGDPGAWTFRGRFAWCTPWYRNVRGDRPEFFMGAAADLSYRPDRGPRFHAGYSGGRPARDSVPYRDEGDLSLGWIFGDWSVSGGLALSSLHSPSIAVERIDAAMAWSGVSLHFESKLSWKPEEEFKVVLTGGGSWKSDWSCKGSVVLKSRSGEFLFDLTAQVHGAILSERLSLLVTLADIPRDWRTGPSGAEELTVELRWKHHFDE